MFLRRSGLLLQKRIDPAYLIDSLHRRKTTSFFGVPDIFLKDVTQCAADRAPAPGAFVVAANSGAAMAMAAGHHLATGGVPCVFLPTNALGDVMSPTLGLLHRDVRRMPCLLLLSWRGEPLAGDDAVEHAAQGKLTEHCLTAMDVPYSITGPADDPEFMLDVILDKAYYHFENDGTPFALLLEPNTFAAYKGPEGSRDGLPAAPLSHAQAAEQIVRQLNPSDAVFMSGGHVEACMAAAREKAGQPSTRDFRAAGAFGYTASLAMGAALATPSQHVVCVEGDGAALAHMGSMATAGGLAALKSTATGEGLLGNFKHIVINDGTYAGAGGVESAALDASLTAVAQGCGYAVVRDAPVLELGELVTALQDLRACNGPAFLEVVVSKGTVREPGELTEGCERVEEHRRAAQEEKTAFMDALRKDRDATEKLNNECNNL